jgi:hypothetical protein
MALEAIGREFGVAHGMADVLVTHVLLNRPCVLAVVGQLVAERMPQLVRVYREGQACHLAEPCNELAHVAGRHRPPRSETNT